MTASGHQTRLRSVNAPPKVIREKSAPKTPKPVEVQATLSQFFPTSSFGDDDDNLDVVGNPNKRRRLSASPVLLARDTYGEDSLDVDQELGIGIYAEDMVAGDDGSWRPSSEPRRTNPRRTSIKAKPKKRRSLAHEDTGTLTQAHNFQRLPSNIPSTFYEAESLDDSSLYSKPYISRHGHDGGTLPEKLARGRDQSPSLLEEISKSMQLHKGNQSDDSPVKLDHLGQPMTPHNKYSRDLIIPSSHSPAVTPLSPYASSQKQEQIQMHLASSPIKSWQSRLTENLMPPPKWKGKLKDAESVLQFPVIEQNARKSMDGDGGTISAQDDVEVRSSSTMGGSKGIVSSGSICGPTLLSDVGSDDQHNSSSSGMNSKQGNHEIYRGTMEGSLRDSHHNSNINLSQQDDNVTEDGGEGSSQQRNVLSSTLSNMNLDKPAHIENDDVDYDIESVPAYRHDDDDDETQATQESIDSIPNSTRHSRAAQLQNELFAHESYIQNQSPSDEEIEVHGTPTAQLLTHSSHDEVIYDTQDEGGEDNLESQPISLPIVEPLLPRTAANVSMMTTTTSATDGTSHNVKSTNNDHPEYDKVQVPSSQIMELTEAILQSESYSQYHKTIGREPASNIFREDTFQSQLDNQGSRVLDSFTQVDNDNNDDNDDDDDGDDDGEVEDDLDNNHDSLSSSPPDPSRLEDRVAREIREWKLKQFGPTQPIPTVSQLLGGRIGGGSSGRAIGTDKKSSIADSDEEL